MRIIFPFILIVLIIASCSSSSDQNAILTRLLEARMKGGVFEKQPGGKDTLTYYGPDDLVLRGTWREMNDYLVITIYTEGQMMEHGYSIAIYERDAEKWKPAFPDEVVFGRLDTILDLNNDQQAEFIVDEYNGNSAGFTSIQALYAKFADSNTYDRIDSLSNRYFGGAAYNQRMAKYTYQAEGSQTTILVHTEKVDMDPDNPGAAKVMTSDYTLAWRPPHVIRTSLEQGPQGDVTEAQAIMDEMANPDREGLLMISYHGEEDAPDENEQLYFRDSLSNLKFKDIKIGDMMEDFEAHLEFNNNTVLRGTKLVTGEVFSAMLYYVKDGQKHYFSFVPSPDSQGRRTVVGQLDPPGSPITHFEAIFNPNENKHVVFIRQNASQFRPGKKYVYDEQGLRYEVDSLLWVREFAGPPK